MGMKKPHNILYEADIFGVWTEGETFVFQNRVTKEKCVLTISQVLDLGREFIEWATNLTKDSMGKEK